VPFADQFKNSAKAEIRHCIHNRFWQLIPISVTQHFSQMSSFSHAAVHPPSMCWAEIIMDVYSTIFKLSASLSAMLHYHYTINIHLYQMAVIFKVGNTFQRSSLNTESQYKSSIQDQVSNFVPTAYIFVPWTAPDDRPTDSPPSVASWLYKCHFLPQINPWLTQSYRLCLTLY